MIIQRLIDHDLEMTKLNSMRKKVMMPTNK